jgi:hypothetical protein
LFTAPGQHQGLLSAAKPGGPYFSTDDPEASPLLRAVLRNTGTARAAIALSVSAGVLAP